MRKSRKKLYFGVILLVLGILFFVFSRNPGIKNEVETLDTRKVEKPIEIRKTSLIVPSGKFIEERFTLPNGFERTEVEQGSFGAWLRKYPLKGDGSLIHFYNGEEKQSENHAAVLDLDVGKRDLQQCADSIIRLRAEYFYKKKEYEKIQFHFTDGFLASYGKWRKGYGIASKGNSTTWVRSGRSNESRESFQRYLNMVFSYSGTLSLEKELRRRKIKDMEIGDVFIRGGSPGHCLIVMDMAKNKSTDETLFIVAQGFMPAQEMHIMKNVGDPEISPWYRLKENEDFNFVETTFNGEQLRSFE